jgi:ABC-type uncharacterized transport system permease subunit
MWEVIFSFAALLSLLPLLILPYRGLAAEAGAALDRPPQFWAALGLAASGPAAWSVWHLTGHWAGGLSNTLWLTNGVCLALFALLCLTARRAWRLCALLGPYVAWVGLVATVTAAWPGKELRGGAPGGWIDLHIAVSVITYALVTLAAVASLAAFLQQRALKTKRINKLTRFLPPVVESDLLQFRLLAASEAVLAAGLATGMAVLHFEHGVLLRLDHKTLLSLAAFGVIAALLIAHTRSGLGGRVAARLVLIAYLLLTLAYPGVKFVTDVLMD